MGVIVTILLVLFFWVFLLRSWQKRIAVSRPSPRRIAPRYDLSDICPKRRGETALCGYCPLFDLETGECARGRWRS